MYWDWFACGVFLDTCGFRLNGLIGVFNSVDLLRSSLLCLLIQGFCFAAVIMIHSMADQSSVEPLHCFNIFDPSSYRLIGIGFGCGLG